jgi:hypothetical protein
MIVPSGRAGREISDLSGISISPRGENPMTAACIAQQKLARITTGTGTSYKG